MTEQAPSMPARVGTSMQKRHYCMWGFVGMPLQVGKSLQVVRHTPGAIAAVSQAFERVAAPAVPHQRKPHVARIPHGAGPALVPPVACPRGENGAAKAKGEAKR
eukprot:4731911-Pleurochrysis_carterae.AAC.1